LVCRSKNRGLQAKEVLLKTFQIAEGDEETRNLIRVVQCDLALVDNGMNQVGSRADGSTIKNTF
jgi:hypothetical protein